MLEGLALALAALAAVATLVVVLLRDPSKRLNERLTERVGALDERLRREVQDGFQRQRSEAANLAQQQRDELAESARQAQETLLSTLKVITDAQHKQLGGFEGRLSELTQRTEQRFDALRVSLEQRVAALQTDTATKLEQMRKTVDEQLQETLQKRLNDSFKLVSERLEQVQRGLGEMQTLAASVGDLKSVLTNVKTRGTWGEYHLASLLEQVLAPEQYATNVAVKPDGRERVEFAIRLPGNDPTLKQIWLPIDAKFPVEDYQRLTDSAAQADQAGVEAAAKALETRIKNSAKEISEKYIAPPHTTDFAVLYVPTEGLYAEVLRRPGLVTELQQRFRVTVAGPTTLAALLSSLQMGFRTLAIQQRSSEVWALLGKVKEEFGKYAGVIEKVRKKLQEAANVVETVGTRTRAIDRQLNKVGSASDPGDPPIVTPQTLPLPALGIDPDDLDAPTRDFPTRDFPTRDVPARDVPNHDTADHQATGRAGSADRAPTDPD